MRHNSITRGICGLTRRADPANASHWPPLLFLVDLYNQALLTMGDDEFFSSSPATLTSAALTSTSVSTTVAARNPLTLDEITSFSRQLLNIAFHLYWREDASNDATVPGMPNLKLEAARERMTKLLQAIHAREYVTHHLSRGMLLTTPQLATTVHAAGPLAHDITSRYRALC